MGWAVVEQSIIVSARRLAPAGVCIVTGRSRQNRLVIGELDYSFIVCAIDAARCRFVHAASLPDLGALAPCC